MGFPNVTLVSSVVAHRYWILLLGTTRLPLVCAGRQYYTCSQNRCQRFWWPRQSASGCPKKLFGPFHPQPPSPASLPEASNVELAFVTKAVGSDAGHYLSWHWVLQLGTSKWVLLLTVSIALVLLSFKLPPPLPQTLLMILRILIQPLWNLSLGKCSNSYIANLVPLPQTTTPPISLNIPYEIIMAHRV